jgi:hypothetical protein
VSAPALALAKVRRRVVVVRLADAAEAVAVLSAAYALALLAFPVSFPQRIVNSWEHGQLMMVMMILAFVLDTFLYVRVAHIHSARPGVLAAACLGSLPILIVAGMSLLLQKAVHSTLTTDLPNLQGRVAEEVLAHTYLAMVAAIFLPFLVIRLAQQFKFKRKSA